MIILPRGITGFNVPEKQARPDEKTFVSDCWAAVGSRGRVEDRSLVLAGEPASFLTRVLVLSGYEPYEAAVLLNTVYPWVGFCRPFTPLTPVLEFVDEAKVAEALASTGRYRVLQARELEQPVAEDQIAELGRGERHELKCWRGFGPIRLGDVVFNFWD